MDLLRLNKEFPAFFTIRQMSEQLAIMFLRQFIVHELTDLLLNVLMVHTISPYRYGFSIACNAVRDLNNFDFTALTVVPVTDAISS